MGRIQTEFVSFVLFGVMASNLAEDSTSSFSTTTGADDGIHEGDFKTSYNFSGIIYERPEPCTWPDCGSGCSPCDGRLSSECSTDDAMYNRSCGGRGRVNKTDDEDYGICQFEDPDAPKRLTQCVCPEGYCDGAGGFCVKRHCWRGGTPPPFTPSKVARIYAALAFGGVPLRSDPQNFATQWVDFIIRASCVPVLLLIIGLLATILSCTCIAMPGWGEYKCCMGMEKRTTWRLSVASAILVFVISLAGLIIGHRANNQYCESLGEAVTYLTDTMKEFLTTVHQISIFIKKLISLLFHEVPDECPWPIPDVLDSLIKRQKKWLEIVQISLGILCQGVDPMYAVIESSNPIIKGILLGQLQINLVPLGMIFGLSILVVFTLMRMHFYGMCVTSAGFCTRMVNNWERKVFLTTVSWCNVFFVCYSATSLAIAIMFSGFCMDPDSHILGLTAQGRNDNKVLNYYLRGEDANPISLQINQLFDSLQEARGTLGRRGLSEALSMIGYVCPVFSPPSINMAIVEPMRQLSTMNEMIHVRKVYPLYDRLVRKGMCSEAIHSIGIAAFLTCATSCVLWPMLVCVVSLHMQKWVNQDHYVKRELKGSDGEFTTDFSDDEDGLLDEEEDEGFQ